tara:strand:+ start:309 stop:707 length:399 start_codon:yes stop_codon:yes gene_type:complete
MGKRHSIDTIAEVLIDKIEAMEKVADKIDKAKEKPIQIEVSELKQILEKQENIFKTQRKYLDKILSDLKSLKEVRHSRIPFKGVVFLGGFFLTSICFCIYSLKKAEGYELHKAKAEHFEIEYLKLMKEKEKK